MSKTVLQHWRDSIHCVGISRIFGNTTVAYAITLDTLDGPMMNPIFLQDKGHYLEGLGKDDYLPVLKIDLPTFNEGRFISSKALMDTIHACYEFTTCW